MIKLNKEQQRAAETLTGNLLIIASAGTGKTTTIVERYANLLELGGLHPEEILMTTFTNKAAKDMVEKIKKRTDMISTYIGTMHSIFLRILRDNKSIAFGSHDYTLITDRAEQKKILREVLTECNLPTRADAVNYFMNWISKFKNRGILAENLSWEGGIDEARKSGQITEMLDDELITVDSSWREGVNKIYKKYQEYLHKYHLMDFDEILLLTYKLFEENPEILQKYKDQFKTIMVDEAQDLNVVQINILEQLRENNLCLIGDDCQNIYEWRGTSNDLIFKFQTGEDNIFLKENYRSDNNIIDAVNKTIESMRNKVDKELISTKDYKNQIEIRQYFSSREEMDEIVSEIEELINSGENPANFAVLFRTNNIGKFYEREFRRRQIPCHLAKTVDFFSREEIKDSLAFLNLCINPTSIIDFTRMLGLLKGVGKVKVRKLMIFADENKINFLEAFERIDELDFPIDAVSKIKKLAQAIKADDSFNAFLKDFGYYNHLNNKYFDEPGRLEEKLENIDVLLDLYRGNENKLIPFMDSLIEVERKEEANNRVTLSTVHGAKGLEWKHVYLASCNEKTLPFYKEELTLGKRDSELRLFYVAISRAKDHLTITSSKSQGYMFSKPSQFIEIIDKSIDKPKSTDFSPASEL